MLFDDSNAFIVQREQAMTLLAAVRAVRRAEAVRKEVDEPVSVVGLNAEQILNWNSTAFATSVGQPAAMLMCELYWLKQRTQYELLQRQRGALGAEDNLPTDVTAVPQRSAVSP